MMPAHASQRQCRVSTAGAWLQDVEASLAVLAAVCHQLQPQQLGADSGRQANGVPQRAGGHPQAQLFVSYAQSAAAVPQVRIMGVHCSCHMHMCCCGSLFRPAVSRSFFRWRAKFEVGSPTANQDVSIQLTLRSELPMPSLLTTCLKPA